jgi:hypothetical protein
MAPTKKAAPAKKKKTVASKAASKKSAVKKAPAKAKAKKVVAKKKVKAAPAAPKKAAAKAVDLASLDRKGLAARARQLKVELMGIRFNLQAPSLKEYRLKRKELSAVLGQLK